MNNSRSYGGSISQYGSPDRTRDAKVMKELEDKVSALRREFDQIDLDHNTYINREELYQYLDRKTGKPFNRNIANEIFDHMDKNHDNRITVNEFIRVYI